MTVKTSFKRDGFTLIELIVVVAIICTLAAIAIMNFAKHRTAGYDNNANYDARAAYIAAQSYYADYPSAKVTLNKLISSGYNPTQDVQLDIVQSEQNNLEMTSYHPSGSKTFTVDTEGKITN